MKTRHMLMGGGLLIAAGLAFFGDKRPTGLVEVTPTTSRARADRPREPEGHREPRPSESRHDKVVLVSTLMPRGLSAATASGLASSDSMFQARSWVPPPQPATASAPAVQAPPLTLTYLGLLENSKAQIDKVLLADGDKTFVVGIDEQVGDQYKVRSITRQAIVLEYLPLRQQQTLSIP